MIINRKICHSARLNKVCAHPVIVSWAVGACVLNTATVALILHGSSLSAIISGWQTILRLLLALIPTTILGYFLGMFTCWPLIRVICSKYNGAPLKAGDQVIILSGPQKGNIARVYEIIVGQGGWGSRKGGPRPRTQREIHRHF